MEDKTFELMTKMYSEFTGFRKEANSRFDKLEAGQAKLEITLEHDIKNSLQALHEREAANYDKLEKHDKQLDEINNKLDYLVLSVNSQDKRLEVVESIKLKKAK